ITGLTAQFPVAAEQSLERYEKAYEEHRHRVYALAFWMTESEVAAEGISSVVFAFCHPECQCVDSVAVLYALAFWMTESEVAAEGISSVVFGRAFGNNSSPSGETIDRLLLSE